MSYASRIFQGHPVLHLQEQQAASVAGGDFNSGGWRIRNLNTIVENTMSGASLSSSEFTLIAGLYHLKARACVHYVNRHRLRLYDVTGAAVLFLGLSQNSELGYGGDEPAFIGGRFTLTQTSALRVEHRCSYSSAANGLGVAHNFGDAEIYADCYIERISP